MSKNQREEFQGVPACQDNDDDDDELFGSSSSISGDSDDEAVHEDFMEDAAAEHKFSKPTSSQSWPTQPLRRLVSDGPLSDLSSLMAQLPVKRGLSKFYEGKSQSFTCLSDVSCLEDLRKKESPLKRKMKTSKSYLVLENESQNTCHVPGPNNKPTTKPPSGNSCRNLVAHSTGKNLLNRPPPIPVHKNSYHH